MEKQLCQSCGMDMAAFNETYGTNADGSVSADYCQHCYTDGKFTADITMSEMIEHWIPYLVKENPSITEDEARRQMEAVIPNLKRWGA